MSGLNPVVMTSEPVLKQVKPVSGGLCLRISILRVFNLFKRLEFMRCAKEVNRA